MYTSHCQVEWVEVELPVLNQVAQLGCVLDLYSRGSCTLFCTRLHGLGGLVSSGAQMAAGYFTLYGPGGVRLQGILV